MRTSAEWLEYFRGNQHRLPPTLGEGAGAIDPALRAALVRSLGRFYLGETGEGRIAQEARQSDDPALDDAMCECITLYVREEGRHARALAATLEALGAPLPKRHYTEAIFRRGRRLLGLRTKMMTIAAAEIVGLAYYGLLAERVPPLAPVVRAIARDEKQHLAFQAEYFARLITRGRGDAGVRGAVVGAGYGAIVSCAIATVVIDHAPLLDALRVPRAELAARCGEEAMRGAAACRALVAAYAHATESRPARPKVTNEVSVLSAGA
jgi:hypothetical protein